MKSAPADTRYLNVVLTVNAVLLAAVLWTQVAGAPALSNAAHAAPQNPPAGGIPNAGGQRERMISELEAIRESVDGLRKTMEAGKMKVTIGNMEELKAAVAASKPADAPKGK